MSARTRGGCRAGLLLSFSAILAAVWRSPVASAHRGYCVRQGAAFVPTAPAAPSWGGMLGRQGYGGIRRQTDVIMAAAKGNGKQGQQTEKWSLFGAKTVEKTANGKKKVVVKAKNTKAKAPVQKQKQAAAGRNAKYQRQSVQRDDSWDVERTRIPVSSVLVGGGVIAAVSTYFGQKWWTKRHAGLITDFVDDMMDAGVDKRALAKTVVQYKSKLGGPFATSRMLNEYLKVVFRAPDLSPSFVEAMDYVVNSLLRIKEQDLLTHIAQVTKEMTRQQEWVGLSILLFTFDRILPPNVAGPKLEPIRRILSKVFPGDIADHMFDLAKDAYTLEVEMMFKRMEPPLVAPSGYEVLGLREKDAQDVFKKLKDEYTPPAVATGSGSLADDLSQSLIVRKRDPIHDMIYGRAEDICDKHISGYKEGKEKKKADANRGRPPTWDETVTRISRMILTKEGEEVVSKLQNFQCQRCTRITTLMAGESEEEAFPPHYTCPTCGSGREMIIRKQ